MVLIGENTKYKYDLQPSPEQVSALNEADVTAMTVKNTDGTVVVTSLGKAPTTTMTIQATKMMVYQN